MLNLELFYQIISLLELSCIYQSEQSDFKLWETPICGRTMIHNVKLPLGKTKNPELKFAAENSDS